MSSINPAIAKGKQYKGKKLPTKGINIVDIITKDIPPPVGFGILWELLWLGSSSKYLIRKGLIFKTKKYVKKKGKKIKIIETLNIFIFIFNAH